MSTEMQTKVQANPAQNYMPAQTGLLQRQCTLCNTPGLVEDSGRDKEKLSLQRSSVDQAGITTVPRFGHDFSRVSVHSKGMIQAKLKINEPGDIYEQEGDRVADAVMRMPENAPVSGQFSSVRTNSASFIQRHTIEETLDEEEEPEELTPILESVPNRGAGELDEEEELTPISESVLTRDAGELGEEEELIPISESVPTRDAGELDEEEEEKLIQPKSNTGAAPQVTPGIAHDIHSLKGTGQPLPASERSFFEPRFGRDFSNVRVHTNERTARIAQTINARAFTLGRDVVFGAGQYSPGAISSRRLLAHELTHVVQQKKGGLCRKLSKTIQCDREQGRDPKGKFLPAKPGDRPSGSLHEDKVFRWLKRKFPGARISREVKIRPYTKGGFLGFLGYSIRVDILVETKAGAFIAFDPKGKLKKLQPGQEFAWKKFAKYGGEIRTSRNKYYRYGKKIPPTVTIVISPKEFRRFKLRYFSRKIISLRSMVTTGSLRATRGRSRVRVRSIRGAGLQILFQGASFVLSWVNDRIQAKRVKAALQAIESSVDKSRKQNRTKGMLLIIYYIGNRYSHIERAMGHTVSEAQRAARNRASLRHRRSKSAQKIWLKPLQAPTIKQISTPFPKVKLCTFVPYKFQDVSWNGANGFDDEGETSVSIPSGVTPKFYVLKPPSKIYYYHGRWRKSLSVPTVSRSIILGGSIPVVDLDPSLRVLRIWNVTAAMVFPADAATASIFQKAPATKDNTNQLRGYANFSMIRWIRPSNISSYAKPVKLLPSSIVVDPIMEESPQTIDKTSMAETRY